MAQAKRGPKAKPKDVEQIESTMAYVHVGKSYDERMREENKWRLASDLLIQKAKLASPLTPTAIVEIANWAKRLDEELYG